MRVNPQLPAEQVAQFAPNGQNAGPSAASAADPNSATGAPGTGGSFPHSFLIPGTDTSVRIGGTVSEELDYWMSGGSPKEPHRH